MSMSSHPEIIEAAILWHRELKKKLIAFKSSAFAFRSSAFAFVSEFRSTLTKITVGQCEAVFGAMCGKPSDM